MVMPRHAVLQRPNMKHFHDALIKHGVDVRSLYKILNLSYDVMSSEEGSINMGKYLQLMELAAESTGNRYLGVERAMARDESSIGMLSYMMRSAKNIGAAFDILSSYLALVSPGSKVELIEDSAEHLILSYSSGDFPIAQCVQDAEAALILLIKMFRTGIDDVSWWPDTLYFQHHEPGPEVTQESPFKTRVIYGFHLNGLRFPKAFLEYPLAQYDPQLLKMLEPQAQKDVEALESSGNLLQRIQHLIAGSIGQDACDAESISTRLGMSRSSLQRRLRELGVTITDLREDIVFNRAKQALTRTNVSITELSLVSGYSESSSFVRAFKRAVGMTPLQYRKKHLSL